MNISKKALMSFIMALTSLISMAQPYYHVMKRDGSNQIEDTVYNAKTYKIRVDMVKPRPKDAIGGRITIENFDCHISPKRSFYFTNKGNVYYNESEGKFHFEKSQLDYPSGPYNKDHCGHFNWGRSIEECTKRVTSLGWPDAKEEDFYFANPDNLGKLQEDLGNEEWTVLSYCEWAYVCSYLGEWGWKVNGKTCFLIDATPGKSLLRTIQAEHNGEKTMSIEEFESYEAKGLVCLPASGLFRSNSFHGQGYSGNYWSCTPSNDMGNGVISGTYFMSFDPSKASVSCGPSRSLGQALRLVVLAD